MACTLLTFCRRTILGRHFITKCCSAYSTKVKKEVIHVPYDEAKDVVLSFFNKCDKVTLQKLFNLKPSRFEQIRDFNDWHKDVSKLSDRFASIDDFMKVYSLTPKNVENMAQSILDLKEKEKYSFGMNAILPAFPRMRNKSIEKVVVLYVFHKKVYWCVRSTSNHAVEDIGFRVFNIPDSYDHTKYHPQIGKFIEILPDSDVYLLHSVARRLRGREMNYFAVQQCVSEAMYCTLLNEKHSKIVKADSLNDVSISNDIIKKTTDQYAAGNWSNCVYLWDIQAMKDFYDVAFKGDQLPTRDIIKHFYTDRKDIIKYWKMDSEQIRKMFYKDGSEQLSLCVLMSDAFCTCLKKTDDAFPSAYS